MNRLLSELRYRLRALFHRGDMERELDAELRFHVDKEAEKLVREGMARDEALRRARLTFGGVDRIKDDTRDARGVSLIETTLQDLRYTLRSLRASKAFTAGVVLTIGLGIGANAAMFGIVDRLLFRAPFGLARPDLVHRVYAHWTQNNEPQLVRNLSFPNYLDFARWTTSFSHLAAFQTRQAPIGDGEDARELPVTIASASYLDLFSARPVLGRYYTAAEDSVPTGTNVIVLGHTFWQTRFGGRPEVLGQSLRVGTALFTIIGVAPEGMTGVSDQGVPALYLPITAFAYAFRGTRYTGNYGWSWLELVVRRKPGVSVAAANADLTQAFRKSWREEYREQQGFTVDAMRPWAELGPIQLQRGPQAGRDAKVATWVSGVALIVLLVACANVTNLLLSRAASRRREVAMRLALGVRRVRLLRQLLTESLVLVALGGLAGLAVARWGASGLRALFLPTDAPAPVFTDVRTLLFAGLATLATAILTGVAPAVQAGRADLAGLLKAGARQGTYRNSRIGTGLLVFQAALSVVLLAGAGLFVRSLSHVRAYRLGYDVEPIAYALANLRGTRLEPAEAIGLNERLLAAAQAIPGVEHASLAVSVPFWSNEGQGLWVPGVDSIRRLGRFVLQAGSPAYFATLGTRILEGRAFDATDAATAPRVMVVSDGMARALWPDKPAIGQCVRIGADTMPCTTVIGIAEEMRVRSLADAREFTYFLPMAQYNAQFGPSDPQVLVRVQGDAERFSETLRRRLQRELPGAGYVIAFPLSRLVDPNLRSWRFGATMFTAFGGLALLLAAIGLYSLVAYGVAQRRQELGVRVALGASAGQIVRLVLGGGLRLVLAGVVLGALIALWTAPRLEPLMFQQPTRDPVVFGVVSLALLGVAAFASLLPALRASRVDPNVALRAE
jgi:predicted permease